MIGRGRDCSTWCSVRLLIWYGYIYQHGMTTYNIGADIVTGYGLDGPGIESRLGRDFPHLYKPALWPTQSPIQCVPGLSRR